MLVKDAALWGNWNLHTSMRPILKEEAEEEKSVTTILSIIEKIIPSYVIHAIGH
jgi:hypothetical protein